MDSCTGTSITWPLNAFERADPQQLETGLHDTLGGVADHQATLHSKEGGSQMLVWARVKYNLGVGQILKRSSQI